MIGRVHITESQMMASNIHPTNYFSDFSWAICGVRDHLTRLRLSETQVNLCWCVKGVLVYSNPQNAFVVEGLMLFSVCKVLIAMVALVLNYIAIEHITSAKVPASWETLLNVVCLLYVFSCTFSVCCLKNCVK